MITDDIIGKYVTLRSITETDATFSLAVRQSSKAVKYMPRLNISLEQQIKWINKQRKMENDYFFVAFNKNEERVGVLGVYDIQDIDGGYGEVGRIVMQGKSVESIESYMLLLHFSFKTLKLKKLAAYVYPNNVRAIRFYKFFGGKLQESSNNASRSYSYWIINHNEENFLRQIPDIMKKLH